DGFDSPNVPLGTWTDDPSLPPNPPYVTVQTIQNAALAHTGAGVLEFAITACDPTRNCLAASAQWRPRFFTSTFGASAGPALELYYRMATSVGYTFTTGAWTGNHVL